MNQLIKFNQNFTNLLNKIKQGKSIMNSYIDKLFFYLVDEKDNNEFDLDDIFAKIRIDEQSKIKIQNGLSQGKVATDKIYRVKIILSKDVIFQNVRCYLILKTAREIGQLYNLLSARGIVEVSEIINEIDLILGSKIKKKEIKDVFSNTIDVSDVKIEELVNKDFLAHNIDLGKSYGLL